MSGRGREARPTSYFSRNDTHQTAIKRIISHCHAEYAYKKRFLEVSSLKFVLAQLDTSKNLWANQDLIDSIGRVAEECRHVRSIPGTF